MVGRAAAEEFSAPTHGSPLKLVQSLKTLGRPDNVTHTNTHTHTYMHTDTHTHTHTYTHTHIHAHTQTYIHKHALTRKGA